MRVITYHHLMIVINHYYHVEYVKTSDENALGTDNRWPGNPGALENVPYPHGTLENYKRD